MTFDNADYGQEKNCQHIANTVIYQYPKGSLSEVTAALVTKEKKKFVKDLSIPASKLVNSEPDATDFLIIIRIVAMKN